MIFETGSYHKDRLLSPYANPFVHVLIARWLRDSLEASKIGPAGFILEHR